MFWNKLTVLNKLAVTNKLTVSKEAHSLAPASRGKLIFALDATASRERTWAHACGVQSTMFDVAAGHGGLDLKLVFFQGATTCRASAWTNKTSELRNWMKAVRCESGFTQIERVLNHALKMATTGRVDALIFVGDAMEEDPELLCRLSKNLGERRVPIFVFQEGNDTLATETFTQMAALSGGARLPFDLANLSRLKELLGGVAAYASGGHLALQQLARRAAKVASCCD